FRMQRRRRGVATWNRETPLMERQGGGQYPIRARWAQHSRAGEHLERTQLLKAEGDRMGTRRASCPTRLATFAQRRECGTEVASHLSGRDSIDDEAGEAARRLIRDAQRDGGDAGVNLAHAPPA